VASSRTSALELGGQFGGHERLVTATRAEPNPSAANRARPPGLISSSTAPDAESIRASPAEFFEQPTEGIHTTPAPAAGMPHGPAGVNPATAFVEGSIRTTPPKFGTLSHTDPPAVVMPPGPPARMARPPG
jgi:hypothetical protein